MYPCQPFAERDEPERPRVLLVEPYERARMLLEQLLLDEGFALSASAPNYAQAIVAARSAHPTVIVTELDRDTTLTPAAYVAALQRHSFAPIIVHSTITPSSIEVADWGLWGTVLKGERPAMLLAMIRRAHAAIVARAGR